MKEKIIQLQDGLGNNLYPIVKERNSNIDKKIGDLNKLNTNQKENLVDAINESKKEIDDKLNKAGGIATGPIIANNNADYEKGQVRNIILSSEKAEPEKMANGDIWIQYES